MRRRALVTYVSQPRPGDVTHSEVALDLPWPLDKSALADLRRDLCSEQGRAVAITSLAWLGPEPLGTCTIASASAPWSTRTATLACAAWFAFGVMVATVTCLAT